MSAGVGYALDVVGGAQRGARVALAADGPTTLGGALERDVVLADPRAAELAMTLRPDADGLTVEVHAEGVSREGEALAPGPHRLVVGETLTIGDTHLRLVTKEARATAETFVGVDDDVPWSLGTPALEAGEPFATVEERGPRLTPPAMVLLGVTLFGSVAIGVSYALHRASTDADDASTVAFVEPLGTRIPRLLAEGGFDDVVYVPGPNVGPRLRGHVASRARLLELQRLVRGVSPRPRVDVRVQEEIVQGVEDFYRTRGIEATVESEGAGVVKVVTRVADEERLAGVEAKAMGDVSGLVLLRTRNEPPESAPAEEGAEKSAARRPFVEDENKRVVAVVSGDPSYVVTADDSRYFVGSALPTGHTIAEIDEDSVVLDREGERTRLEF